MSFSEPMYIGDWSRRKGVILKGLEFNCEPKRFSCPFPRSLFVVSQPLLSDFPSERAFGLRSERLSGSTPQRCWPSGRLERGGVMTASEKES